MCYIVPVQVFSTPSSDPSGVPYHQVFHPPSSVVLDALDAFDREAVPGAGTGGQTSKTDAL